MKMLSSGFARTPPEAQHVHHIKVVTTFLKTGVPLHKLHHFRDLLVERVYKLADRRGMHNLIPYIAEKHRGERC